MKNLFRELDTETLKWMNCKYEHCNGHCDECPCHDASFYCAYIDKQVKKELKLRGE